MLVAALLALGPSSESVEVALQSRTSGGTLSCRLCYMLGAVSSYPSCRCLRPARARMRDWPAVVPGCYCFGLQCVHQNMFEFDVLDHNCFEKAVLVLDGGW